MIHEAKENLTSMGFSEIKKFEDNFGTIGYGVRFMGDDYILVAKEYAHNELASFLERLVVKSPESVDFIFYNNDDGTYTVFDNKFLSENADRSSGPSKKRDCHWLELPLEHGTELDLYVKGDESPDTLSGDNSELGAFM